MSGFNFDGAPFTRILVLDFETRWCSKSYTLSKSTTEAYIRDKRFKAFGVGYKWYGDADDKIYWLGEKEVKPFFDRIDWSSTAVLAHNAQFDCAILSWVYGAKPAFIFDSLSMARALRGIEVGNSLAKLAEELRLPEKGRAVHSTDGLSELTPDIEAELAAYCKHDVFLCEKVFDHLVQGYPTKELKLIDLTLKMFTNPCLELDEGTLVEAIHEERERREGLLSKLDIAESDLASNDKFASILRKLGVEPPLKKKKATPKNPNPTGHTHAFAKNDALFQALLNGDNEDVALLCEARLAVKSTLERTRAQRFLDISRRGTLPVPLNYYGAHTGRWSASKGSGINLQNLKRGSFLRKSISAPEGYSLIVADLSQIEPRVLAYLCDYRELLQIFSSGQDAYSLFGTRVFGKTVSKEGTPDLRQASKAILLGAGYGMGWHSFASQLLTGFLGAPPVLYDKAFAKQAGVDADIFKKFVDWDKNVERALEIPRICTDEQIIVHSVAAKTLIDKYRLEAQAVTEFWYMCNELIHLSLAGGKERRHKGLIFRKGEIVLPSGLSLKYPDLQAQPDEKGRIQWVYGKDKKKLYGGKIVENIVQAVARCVMTDGMLRIQKRYPVVLTVHDEAVALVPEDEAESAYNFMLDCMTTAPKYMPGIPLAADGGWGKCYGDIK
jgi:DNA polymerase III epsilon subunit-like protein